jgi:uncharacterized protein (DUF2237 family)
MQFRAQHQRKKVVVPATSEPLTTAVALGRRRTGTLAVMAAVVCATLVILAIAYVWRGGSALRTTTHPATVAPERPSDADTDGSARLQRAVGWMGGLAAGLILPSDVTSRLRAQDPKLAKVVMAAWSDLNSSGSAIRLREALRWVDGLAAGLILPSDVTSRLKGQDPRMAQVVIAVWSDLNEVTASDQAPPGETAAPGK